MVLLKQLVTSMDIDQSNLVGQSQDIITQSGPSQAALLAAAAANTANNTKQNNNTKPNDTTTIPDTSTTNTNTNNNSTINTDKTGDIFMVFEYVDYDLTGLLDSEYKFEPKQIKVIIWQLLNVLDFLHNRNYVHRDLKCSNILLMDDHTVKLADFGLSRSLANDGLEKPEMSHRVITLWYRPPELLLGATRYDAAIDLWSVGCIIMELFVGKPVLKANVEAEQIVNIMNILGAPPQDSTLRKCPGWTNFIQATGGIIEEKKSRLTEWIQRYPSITADPDLVFLLSRLFEGDPRRRISAREALSTRYFRDIDSRKPLATLKGMLVKQNTTFRSGVDLHEFQAKKRRKDKFTAEQSAIAGVSNVVTNEVAPVVPPINTTNVPVNPIVPTSYPATQSSLYTNTSYNSTYPNTPNSVSTTTHNAQIRGQPLAFSSPNPAHTPGSTSLLGSGPSARNNPLPSKSPTVLSSSSNLVPSQTLLNSKYLTYVQELKPLSFDNRGSRLRQLTTEFLNFFLPAWQPVINRVMDSSTFNRCTPSELSSIMTALQIIQQDINIYIQEVYTLLYQHNNTDIRNNATSLHDSCESILSRIVYDLNRATSIVTTAITTASSTTTTAGTSLVSGTNIAPSTTTNWPNNPSTAGGRNPATTTPIVSNPTSGTNRPQHNNNPSKSNANNDHHNNQYRNNDRHRDRDRNYDHDHHHSRRSDYDGGHKKSRH